MALSPLRLLGEVHVFIVATRLFDPGLDPTCGRSLLAEPRHLGAVPGPPAQIQSNPQRLPRALLRWHVGSLRRPQHRSIVLHDPQSGPPSPPAYPLWATTRTSFRPRHLRPLPLRPGPPGHRASSTSKTSASPCPSPCTDPHRPGQQLGSPGCRELRGPLPRPSTCSGDRHASEPVPEPWLLLKISRASRMSELADRIIASIAVLGGSAAFSKSPPLAPAPSGEAAGAVPARHPYLGKKVTCPPPRGLSGELLGRLGPPKNASAAIRPNCQALEAQLQATGSDLTRLKSQTSATRLRAPLDTHGKVHRTCEVQETPPARIPFILL